MKNIKLRTQLIVAFGGLVALIVSISIFAITSISAQSDVFEDYVNGIRARSEAAHLVKGAVAERAIAARNLVLVTVPADKEAEKNAVLRAQQDVVLNLKHLLELGKDKSVSADALRMIQQIDSIEKRYSVVALSIVDLALKGKKEEAIVKMNEECRPLLASLVSATNEYAQITSRQSATLIKEAEETDARVKGLIILASVVAATIAAGAGVFITKSLLKALGGEPVELCDAVSKVAGGDFTAQLRVASTDTKSVMATLQRMQLSLSDVVRSIRHDANNVAIAAAEISSGNNDLSSRTEQQASTLEETASSMEELTSTVQQNTDNASQVSTLAIAASEIASKGGAVVVEVVNTMESISEASRKIVEIISVIDGIAFQTNILALNAAVEAARAGEQGRGFAVVATEVRNLAHRSASAAKEIKVLIDDSVGRVSIGTKLAADAGATMSDIVSSVKRVTDVIAEIVTASQEQAAGIEQINQAVIEMDNVTQQNSSLVEEAAAAAESLRDQAESLVGTVGMFKIRAEEVEHHSFAPKNHMRKILKNPESIIKLA